MKMTKKEMVRQMLVTAANESVNWVDGMWLIEIIAKNNYAFAIQDWFNAWITGEKDLREVVDKMVDMTWINTSGVNGYTETSSRVLKISYMFK